MENQLFFQLGIDWKLFLSQLVNFFILLAVLTFFVYKPLLKVMKDRNKRIQEGLDKADEADVRLKEIDVIGKGKIKEAENTSISMIKATEQKAKTLEQDFQKKLEESQAKAQKDLKASYEKQQEEIKAMVLRNAVELVKKTIIKTVELNPSAIDEALIKKAAANIKDEN